MPSRRASSRATASPRISARLIAALAAMLVGTSCSCPSAPSSSTLFWNVATLTVAPPRSFAGSTIFVHARLTGAPQVAPPGNLPACVIDHLDSGTRVWLTPRSLHLYPEHDSFVVSAGFELPSPLPEGTYACRLVKPKGELLKDAGPLDVGSSDTDPSPLKIRMTRDGGILLANGFFRALIDCRSGMLRTLASTATENPLLTAESLVIEDPAVDPRRARAFDVRLEESSPYYARLITRHDLGQGLELQRIFEASDGPHLHLACLLRSATTLAAPTIRWNLEAPAGSTIGGPPPGEHPLLQNACTVLTRAGESLLLGKTAYDLWTREPSGPLGGVDDGLEGVRSQGPFNRDGFPIQETVMSAGTLWDVDHAGAARVLGLQPGFVFTFGRVLSAPGRDAHTYDYREDGVYRLLDRNPFYPTWGRLSRAITKSEGWTFANWNDFQYAAELGPIDRRPARSSALLRDMLLRMGHYFADRVESDGGWPRWIAWNVYPAGCHFTAHARAYPFLVYLWGLLRDHEGRKTVFERHLYDMLQSSRPFFAASSPLHFVDQTADGTRYLAYSTYYKEADRPDVAEVANTHAHAYRFAHLMAEVSTMAGDEQARSFWTDVLEWTEPGSQRIYRDLYPAQDPPTGRELHGFIGYSRSARGIMKLPYSAISFMGLADSFQRSGHEELSLIEVVERTTTDYRPDNDSGNPDPAPEQRFLARLYRAQPLSLAFARNSHEVGSHMAGDIEIASLAEVLAEECWAAAHDPAQAILIDGGRVVALTTNPILCDWTPGFFEEVPLDQLGDAQRFRVEVGDSESSPNESFWAAYRRGHQVHVIATVDGTLQVTLPIPPGARVLRRIDPYAAHTWTEGGEALAGENSSSLWQEMTFPLSLRAKDHGVLKIEP
ncbi:MAG: hypothetical protein AB1486_02445 [Planctomycetota bacterium]